MIQDTAQQLLTLVNQKDNILLIAHSKPDGDTLGSSLAFAHYLDSLNKKYEHFCTDAAADYYSYLPKLNQIINDKTKIDLNNYDLVICFDHGSINQSGHGEELAKYRDATSEVRLVNIDHHHTNELFGDINILDLEGSSTSECVHYIFKNNKIPLNKNMATCLMTGILYDTGIFTNSATKHTSLAMASELTSLGASIPQITGAVIQNKNIPSLNLWGEVFSRLKINEKHGIAYTVITQHDLQDQNIKREAIDGLVNFLQGLNGIKAVMLLVEEADGTIKGSLRTTHDDVDVSLIAQTWGGGGHKKASGFKTTVEELRKEGFWN
jgi:phosphoesterase RecJ-like protein